MQEYRILFIVFSYSILVAATIGLVRFNRILSTYQPFVYLCWLSLLNEIASSITTYHFQNNAINCNIYVLGESLLWLWQFSRWKAFRKTNWLFGLLVIGLMALWTFENIILWRISTFSSLFRICYSFVIVFLSISQINRLIVEERKSLFNNAHFLICIGAIIFYTYKIMVEAFYIMNLGLSDGFYNNLFLILVFINLFVNLLFAAATLWIPTRQKFTLRF